MKAIETVYKGYRFRSRLEARWAVFFDQLEISWQYEVEGYDLGEAGWYLPDFWLPLPDEQRTVYPNAGHWLEVKGEMPTDDEIAKLTALTNLTKHTGWIVVGVPGEHRRFTYHHLGYHGWNLDAPTHMKLNMNMTAGEWDADCIAMKLSRQFAPFMQLEQAILAARQARFEHGGNGRHHVSC